MDIEMQADRIIRMSTHISRAEVEEISRAIRIDAQERVGGADRNGVLPMQRYENFNRVAVGIARAYGFEPVEPGVWEIVVARDNPACMTWRPASPT